MLQQSLPDTESIQPRASISSGFEFGPDDSFDLEIEGSFEEDESSVEDVKLLGLSKILRILSGKTRRAARPDKVQLALRILLGLSIIEGNSVKMAQYRVPEVLQQLLTSDKAQFPHVVESALLILSELTMPPENHFYIARSCLGAFSKILPTCSDEAVTTALGILYRLTASDSTHRLLCSYPAILRWFASMLIRPATPDHTVSAILDILLRLVTLPHRHPARPAPHATPSRASTPEESHSPGQVPSARRMGLCSLAALENLAHGAGIDPYQYKREGLIEALLRARHPPITAAVLEAPGVAEGLLSVLCGGTARAGGPERPDAARLAVCRLLVGLCAVPDNRLELIYGPSEGARRVAARVEELLAPVAAHHRAYLAGPPPEEDDDDGNEGGACSSGGDAVGAGNGGGRVRQRQDPHAAVRTAYRLRFDTGYDAWAFYDRAGDWIVTDSDFEALSGPLRLDRDGISVADVVRAADPRCTR